MIYFVHRKLFRVPKSHDYDSMNEQFAHDQNLRCAFPIVILVTMSFFQDFFWKSMVFEGLRFQDIDTLY